MKGEEMVAAPAFWIKLPAFGSPQEAKVPGYTHSLRLSTEFHVTATRRRRWVKNKQTGKRSHHSLRCQCLEHTMQNAVSYFARLFDNHRLLLAIRPERPT